MRVVFELEGIVVKSGKTIKGGKDYVDVIKIGDSKPVRVFGVNYSEGEKVNIKVATNVDVCFAVKH